MKKQIALSVIFLILIGQICLLATAQTDTNYWHYHELIYKAECAIFDSDKIDAGFQYYDQAFNNFEFNYVHDLMNAAQLAHFYHRDYMKYLKKAVGYGLRPIHLDNVSAWKNTDIQSRFLEFYQSEEGQALRQQYLSTINQEYLAWLYRFSLQEVKYRRSPDPDKLYRGRFIQWDQQLLEKIEELGFPGARLVGIDDSLLYLELDNKDLDFNHLVQMSADSLCSTADTTPFPMVFGTDTLWVQVVNPTYSCFDLNTGNPSQTLPTIYLVHHNCPVRSFSFIYNEITKGNLHPREFAYMIDISRSAIPEDILECNCGDYANSYFRMGNGDAEELWQSLFMPEDETDALRKQYWIIPLHVERAKASFAEKYGYRFNWGMNNCFK